MAMVMNDEHNPSGELHKIFREPTHVEHMRGEKIMDNNIKYVGTEFNNNVSCKISIGSFFFRERQEIYHNYFRRRMLKKNKQLQTPTQLN